MPIIQTPSYINYKKLYNNFLDKYLVTGPSEMQLWGKVGVFYDGIHLDGFENSGKKMPGHILFEPKYNQSSLNELNEEKAFYSTVVKGYEHIGSNFLSSTGNIHLISNKGTQITGSEMTAPNGTVNIEARAPLIQKYTSTTVGTDGKAKTINASIIMDGLTDFYEKGADTDQSYSMRRLVIPTVITGSKGVTIQTVGSTTSDNLVLQATGVIAQNGDIKIQANKNILFDAAVESSYDRSTKIEKKKSWGGLKKKKITTTIQSEEANASSVDMQAKNIYVESKEQNQNNSVDIHSGRFIADEKISIRSGGKLNFYTVEESSTSQTDVTKKSSFAGIKLGTSKTSTTREILSALPTALKADYIGAKSGYDMRLEGTEFQYLKGATLESGGKIEMFPAIKKITDITKKEKNSVVWQSMQDKGSITETAKLPSFNGPISPTFKATGGLIVQVPISEKDQNKVVLRDEILKLANQPGNQYLKDLVNRKDIDWQKVILTQKDWDYKSQGLTGAAAAIIVIIVAIVTYGAGTAAIGTTTAAATGGGTVTTFGGMTLATTTAATTTATGATIAGVTTYTTLGTMVNAALTSIATQSSISLINNEGDFSQTLKDIGSKESIKSLATSVVTAGLLDGVNKTLNLPTDSTKLVDKIYTNTVTSLTSSIVEASINGNLSNLDLESVLLNALSNSLQAEAAGQIHDLRVGNSLDMNYVVSKILHAASGCAAAAISKKECEAGAIGAAMGEIVAEEMKNGRYSFDLSAADKLKIENVSKLIAGTTAAALGYDVNTAINTSTIAVQNNALADDLKKLFKDSALKASGGTVGAFLSLGSLGLPFVNAEERAKLIEGIKIIANSKEPLILLKLGMIQNHQEFKNLDALMAMQNDTFGRAMVDAKYTMDIVQMISGVAALPKAIMTTGKLGASATAYVVNGTKVIVSNGRVKIAGTAAEIKFVDQFVKASNGEGLFSKVTRGVYNPTTNTLLGQANPVSCAAASCKMAAGLLDMSEVYVRAAIQTTDEGTLLSNIPNGLKALDFRGTATYSANLSLNEIQAATQKGAAVILNVKTETGGYHAIVVDSIKNGTAFIRDPWPINVGSSYSVPVDALGSVMTGKAVVVKRF